MHVNKKTLAEIFGCDVRTITAWQSQGLPQISGGGKGVEIVFDSAKAIAWFAEREASMENEKLRREVDDFRASAESGLIPGTIDYERYRLTKAQADGQELKNQVAEGKLVDVAFCSFALSKLAMSLSSVLDAIPLSMQRQFPDLSPRHTDYLKTQVAKSANICARAGDKLPELLSEFIPETDE